MSTTKKGRKTTTVQHQRQQQRKRKFQKPIRKRGRQEIPKEQMCFLKPSEADILKLLAAQSHIGRRRSHVNMNRYIWKRRQDGIHVINLEKTWAKLILAARILVTVNVPKDICVMSSRNHGQRGAIKFAHYTGATAMVGKWVPGTFTNPQNKAFYEPRVVLVDDPSTCFAALRETSYIGVPVIAFCGIDNNTRFVDCAIPCNNRGTLSVGLMFWLLTRELLKLKGEINRGEEWGEAVDLFFYRDAGEIQRQQEAKARRALKKQQDELQHQYDRQYGHQQPELSMEEQQQQQQQEIAVQPQVRQPQVQEVPDQGQILYQQQQQQQQQQEQYINEPWEMAGLEDWGAPQAPMQPQPMVDAPPPMYAENQAVDQYADDGQEQPQQPQQPPQQQQQQQQGYYDGTGMPTVPW